MRAALVAAALLLPRAAAARDCPDGSVSVGQGQCARDMSRANGPFMDLRPKRRGARCPAGTHTVESPVGFRCVMGSGDGDTPVGGPARTGRGQAAEASGAPSTALVTAPAAAVPARVEAPPAAPLEKVLTVDAPPPERPAPAGPPKDFVPLRAKGLQLSLPRGWHVTDAWSDEVPTVYVEEDARRRGKPVTMLVSRLAPGQEGYETMADAIAKEKEYQGAKEGPPRRVSGLEARQTVVAGETRSAYVDAGGGVYYLLSFSAPKEVFSSYEPAFEKLLSSARLGR
jgi:hypothetical protein